MIRRMIHWMRWRYRWPLVLRSTYEQMCHARDHAVDDSVEWQQELDREERRHQKTREERDKLLQLNRDLDAQATGIQRRFTQFIDQVTPLGIGRSAFLLSDEQIGNSVTYYTTPRLYSIATNVDDLHTENLVSLMECRLRIGLSKHQPPELVAHRIGAEVEDFILRQWRHQSILLRA